MKKIINKWNNESFVLWMIPLVLCTVACTNPATKQVNQKSPVVIQPFKDISNTEINLLKQRLKEYIPNIQIEQTIDLPKSSFYQERNRYRADSIIHFLRNRATTDQFIIGVTGKDISTSVHGKKDWGVMGLGFTPGPSCVVSTFRLSPSKKSQQLFKVAIHELGHTQGLDHCPSENCFMRDAGGRNITDQLTGFCESCSRFLRYKGWTIPQQAR